MTNPKRAATGALWRFFFSGVAAAALLLATTGVASAHDVGPGSNWYWIGTDGGGTIWCAQSYSSFYEYYPSPHNYFEAWASTAGARDLYCGNNANAPGGYYHVNARLLWSDGTVCRDWVDDSLNANQTNVAPIHRTFVNCGSGTYKDQSWHAAALDFGWRYNLTTSGSHSS